MDTGAVDRNALGIARNDCGSHTGTGNSLSVTIGYRPKLVMLIDMTNGGQIIKIDSMAKGKTLVKGKVDEDNAIEIEDGGFIVSEDVMKDKTEFVWFTN